MADNPHNPTPSAPSEEPQQNQPKKEVIAQYIFLRRDLNWPAGAMAAQAAHAAIAAVAEGQENDDETTKTYVNPENRRSMTKYVYGVEDLEELEKVRSAWNKMWVSNDSSIRNAEEFLKKSSEENSTFAIKSYWWLEQPENTPSAFASWPVVRTNRISKLVKTLKLSFF